MSAFSRRRVCPWALGAGMLLAAVGCDGGQRPERIPRVLPAPEAGCVDPDGDTRGAGCSAGPDCNEADPTEWADCGRCFGASPQMGCACAPGAGPTPCYLDPSDGPDGRTMCHEGTRFCREGAWSACEDIHSFEPPAGATTAGIDPEAGPEACSLCNPVCFRVTDSLDPLDGGVGSTSDMQLAWADGGGLTLAIDPATLPMPEDPSPPDDNCMPGTAPDRDCDGLDDAFDPYPDDPPFATANPVIFLDIPPGETGTGRIDLQFFLNSADVYFLVDQSGSMGGERAQLVADLTAGDFIADPDYACADYDFDGQPNDELKTGGIVGAIRCLIRDSQFGVGLFREIPFGTNFGGYAGADQVVFDNTQDITASSVDLQAGIDALQTIGNRDWPEAAMPALHTLVSGDGMYFGVDRPGIPPRLDCPEGRRGYPCFRRGAIPIVVLFTDAMMHNGPPDNAYPYDPDYLGMNVGTEGVYLPAGVTHEDFGSAHDAGDLTDALRTFTGDSSAMAADVPAEMLSCLGVDGGSDAIFRFTLTQARDVRLSTQGSRYDTVLALYSAVPETAESLPDADNLNEGAGSAQDLGQVDERFVLIVGDTTGMAADYDGQTAGCDAAPDAPDAMYQFSLAADATVHIDSVGSDIDTVLTLYDAPPPVTPTFLLQPDTNDTLPSAHDLGDVYGQALYVSGDSGGLSPDYTGVDVGCDADDAAADVAYAFSLSSNTRVRIATEGSAIDTVLALVGNACVGEPGECDYASTRFGTVPGSAEEVASAADIGTLQGAIVRLSGDTGSMDADFSDTEIGCGTTSGARDAVVHFSLSETTDVALDTDGSSFDTVVALLGPGSPSTIDVQSAGDNEDTDAAQELGSLDERSIVVTGSTVGMTADHSGAEMGCAPNGDTAPDAAFRFTLDAPTRVRLDTFGSSFDTALSLHDGPIEPPVGQIDVAVSTESEQPGSAQLLADSLDGNRQRLTGDTSAMLPHFNFPGADDAGPDAVVRFTVGADGDYRLDTEGSSFDTSLCIYPVPAGSDPVPYLPAPGGLHTTDTAYALGDGAVWRHALTGTTTTDGFDASACGGVAADAPDAIFEFTLQAAERVALSTFYSTFDTALSLYAWDDPGHTTYSLVDCDIDRNGKDYPDSSALTKNLGAGDYFVVVTGETTGDAGTYSLSLVPQSLGDDNAIACDDDGGAGNAALLTPTLAAGEYYAVVKGQAGGDAGAFVLNLLDPQVSGAGDNHQLSCNDDAGGALSEIDSGAELPAGEYYVILSGSEAGDEGNFTLTLTDVGFTPPPAAITCDDDSGAGGGSSALSYPALPPGDYYAVVKGAQNNQRGAYALTLRDASADTLPVAACDDDGGDGSSSVIERDLVAGKYSILVKGAGPGDSGGYRLSVRDVGELPFERLACDDDGGGGGSSSLSAALTAGDYYLGVKGDGAAEAGAYALRLRHDAVQAGDVACDDDSGGYGSSELTASLEPGTYYAAVKGYGAAEAGDYQLTMGAATTSAETYVPPTWSETLTQLQDTETRVMSVLSCRDDPAHGDGGDCDLARAQAVDLANASGALGASLQPLVFDIDSDGGGLSKTVVDGIASLTDYLEMDIEVQVLFYPDENPAQTPFVVTIEAVSQPGDDCEGVVGNVFQRCKPGASPRFLIRFENPEDNPVPLNPDDPLGGYNFRAQLIGNGQFLVDEVPIYIIPENVVPDEVDPGVYTEGLYWQDVEAAGCDRMFNERPDWRDLTWSASAPVGSRIEFSACGGDTPAELETCTPRSVVTLTGVGSCTTDADCALGYCDLGVGACQVATAGSCVADADCPSNAVCDAGSCAFSSQPVLISEALSEADGSASDNLRPHLRLFIGLALEDAYAEPPIVHEWGLTYVCTTSE